MLTEKIRRANKYEKTTIMFGFGNIIYKIAAIVRSVSVAIHVLMKADHLKLSFNF